MLFMLLFKVVVFSPTIPAYKWPIVFPLDVCRSLVPLLAMFKSVHTAWTQEGNAHRLTSVSVDRILAHYMKLTI